ncbi:MAG: transglycosylase domain-containing protein, partial [Bradyrhizobiaceae bacterium]|nr:transglycosylase domain-containing protein [Bradyrhizobiaceae bacterium]
MPDEAVYRRRWAEKGEDGDDKVREELRAVLQSRRPADRDGERPVRSGWVRLAYWGTVLALWTVIGLGALFTWVGFHLPPVQSLHVPKRPPAIEIRGADGHVFATRGEMGGAAIPLSDMPDYLPKAFIAIEDRRFYEHHGIDPWGLIRAAVSNLLHRNISQG